MPDSPPATSQRANPHGTTLQSSTPPRTTAQDTMPQRTTPQRASGPRDFLGAPFRPRTWAYTLDALLDLPVGITGFVYVVTLLALGAGTAITVIGIPVLTIAVLGGRALGAAERMRARTLLGVHVPRPSAPTRLPGAFGWFKAHLSDPAGWRALLYLFFMLPIGIINFTLTVTLWATALGAMAYPLWYFYLPEGGAIRLWETVYLDTFGESFWMVTFGVIVFFLTPHLVRRLAGVRRGMVRELLGPGWEAQ